MGERGKYNTRQRDEIISYMKTIAGTHITVSEIVEHFSQSGKKIGATTVYRHLARLIDEGRVKKYTLGGSDASCYEYIENGSRCCKPDCYHLKCEKCGRLIHLDCRELSKIQTHILDAHGFQLNMFRTVLYGVCKECR